MSIPHHFSALAPDMREKDSASTRHRLILLLIILSAFAVRLRAIHASSLWLDELIQVHLASQPLDNILATMFDHVNVPVDILLTKAFLKFGNQDGWLRLSSAFFGTMCVPLMYAVARKLTPPPVPVLSSLLIAFSPLAVQHSREIRPYSAFLMFTLFSILFFLMALERPRYWVLFVPAMLLTLYTHLFAIALLPVLGVFFFLWCLESISRNGWRWSLLIAPIVLALVLLGYLLSPISPDYIGRIGSELINSLGNVEASQNLTSVQIAYPFPETIMLLRRLPIDFTGMIGPIALNGVLGVIGIILALLGIFSLRKQRLSLIFLLAWSVIIPFLIIFALAQRNHWFSPRYIIQVLPAILILVAAGLAHVGGWVGQLGERFGIHARGLAGSWSLIAVTIIYLIFVGPSLAYAVNEPHENIREAAGYLQEHYQPGDLVVAPVIGSYLDHYLPQNIPVLDLQSGAAVEMAARDYERLFILQTQYGRLRFPDAPWINPGNRLQVFEPSAEIYRGPAGDVAAIRLGERLENGSLFDPEQDYSQESLRQLVNEARNMQEWDMVVPVLQNLLARSPEDAGLWTELGFALQKRKEYDRAIEAYDKSIALDPREAWPHLLAANSYRHKGDPASGLAYAQAAVELAPNMPEARTALGNIELLLGKPVVAMEHFSQGIAQNKDCLDCRYGYALAAVAAGSPDQERAWIDLLSLNATKAMVNTACQHLGNVTHPKCNQEP